MLGRITSRLPHAERLIRKMRHEFGVIARKRGKPQEKLHVYCEAWPNPRISSPPWVAEIVDICGCEMAVPAGQKVSEEQVAQAEPDVIVLAWAATGAKSKPEKAYGVEAWKDVPAIRKRQVYVVRDELLNTPGPPLVAGAKELFRIFQRAATEANKK
jgi:ABC-type Fe3+-hydroxamate transport system substrate-binding protein